MNRNRHLHLRDGRFKLRNGFPCKLSGDVDVLIKVSLHTSSPVQYSMHRESRKLGAKLACGHPLLTIGHSVHQTFGKEKRKGDNLAD